MMLTLPFCLQNSVYETAEEMAQAFIEGGMQQPAAPRRERRNNRQAWGIVSPLVLQMVQREQVQMLLMVQMRGYIKVMLGFKAWSAIQQSWCKTRCHAPAGLPPAVLACRALAAPGCLGRCLISVLLAGMTTMTADTTVARMISTLMTSAVAMAVVADAGSTTCGTTRRLDVSNCQSTWF